MNTKDEAEISIRILSFYLYFSFQVGESCFLQPLRSSIESYFIIRMQLNFLINLEICEKEF